MHLSEVAPDVPAIVMRGISKELPWPGSRCGWIEVLNRANDQNFSAYVDSLLAAKRLEVCSTSGPQLVVPRVFGDPRYVGHLKTRSAMFAERAKEAEEAFAGVRGVARESRAGRLLRDGHVRARRAGRQSTPAHREPGAERHRRAAVRDGGARRALRLPLAGRQGHLRGAADRLLLAARRASGSPCSRPTTRSGAGRSRRWPRRSPSTWRATRRREARVAQA